LETDELELFIAALNEAVESEKAEKLFSTFSEPLIWRYTRIILNNDEYYSNISFLLLQAIYVSFQQFADKSSLYEILFYALQPTNDSLVYSVAQNIVVKYARDFDASTAKRLHNLFIHCYTDQVEDGDQYIAMRALEGFIMFPIYREDNRLLLKGLGFILTDFPLPPDDPNDAALLSVKALKLLGRCYDQQPNEEITKLIQKMINQENYAVKAEAKFNLGIVKLYDAFRANDENTFRAALSEASHNFEDASCTEEGRTDADLFSAFAKLYLNLSKPNTTAQISSLVREAINVFIERAHFFKDNLGKFDENVESSLIRIIIALEHFMNQLEIVHQHPNLSLPMKELAHIYASVRTWEELKGFFGSASRAGSNWIVLPKLRGKFVQVQEITSKLSTMLADPYWYANASQTEVEFCEFMLKEIHLEFDQKKTLIAARLEHFRVEAERDAPNLANLIIKMKNSNLNYQEMMIEILQNYLSYIEEQNIINYQVGRNNGPVQEIHANLTSKLLDNLQWDKSEPKWKYLSDTLKLITNYFVSLYQITTEEAKPEDVKFLFSTDSRGLGKDATEGHLESHFYLRHKLIETMLPNWYGTIHRQEIANTPGRADLLFGFPGNIVYVVEVKCEGTNISQSNIQKKYIAQAQSYAAGTQQISILLVLDTTTKAKGIPLLDVREYCYIARIEIERAKYPNYVVVFIFPANRHLPSKHTPS
jgi:hypothetical protein